MTRQLARSIATIASVCALGAAVLPSQARALGISAFGAFADMVQGPTLTCSVDIDKTVAPDDGCDGVADAAFVDSVTQKIDECVVYKICVTSGPAGLTGVVVSDGLAGTVDLDFGDIAGDSTVCKYVPTAAVNTSTICPATEPVTCPPPEINPLVCRDVEGENIATVTSAFCANPGTSACDLTESDCEDNATVTCEEPKDDGCLTHTPGYWGEHPAVTALFLPVTTCGLELADVEPGLGSITEDLCSIGKDHKNYGSPQQAQLVRQCAAAALNIAASAYFGGSCENSLSFARFDECCGSESACAAGPSECIEDLDTFNNSEDTFADPVELCPNAVLGTEQPCDADPAWCQEAGDNGIVNHPDPEARAFSRAGSALTVESTPAAGGCASGPGGVLALLGVIAVLARKRQRN